MTNDNREERQVGLGRRELLQGAAAGAVGAGLLGVTELAMGKEEKDDCPHILRFSKNLEAKIGGWKCRNCECKGQRNSMFSFEFRGALTSNEPCDDTGKLIPDKSVFSGSVSFTVTAGKCAVNETTTRAALWGCHEGRFRISGVGGLTVLSGTLGGTFGFDPSPGKADQRCCSPYGYGSLAGKGIENLTGCKLCASYLLKIGEINFIDPCTKTPPRTLVSQLDGVLVCPCDEKG